MIERSPYKIEMDWPPFYRVIDPSDPHTVLGVFEQEIDAINYANRLWDEQLASSERRESQ
jgi:hypothetical protein